MQTKITWKVFKPNMSDFSVQFRLLGQCRDIDTRYAFVCVCVCVCALVKADFRGHSQHFRPSYRGPRLEVRTSSVVKIGLDHVE